MDDLAERTKNKAEPLRMQSHAGAPARHCLSPLFLTQREDTEERKGAQTLLDRLWQAGGNEGT